MIFPCLVGILKILHLEEREQVIDYAFRDDGEDGNANISTKTPAK